MIRRLADHADEIYLTFDDGPSTDGTHAVLDVLRKHDARATFFMIADRLSASKELVARVRREGHAIGNHSLDHRYRRFFQRAPGLTRWITQSENAFAQAGISELVGFRPPAGIVTPPLRHVLRARGEPMVLWNERFFDAVWSWRMGSALRSARRIAGGSIVLLHDRQKPSRTGNFCLILDAYIAELKARGLKLSPLTRELCVQYGRSS